MRKPLEQMTPEEKEALVAQLKIDFAAEDYFTGVLGHPGSVFKPVPRRKPTAKKSAKAAKMDD